MSSDDLLTCARPHTLFSPSTMVHPGGGGAALARRIIALLGSATLYLWQQHAVRVVSAGWWK